MPVDRSERSDMIDRLRAETDEARERIAEREAERERDPIKMDDYLRSKRDDRSAFERRRYVDREAPSGELAYRTTENALQPTPALDADAANAEGWDRWIKAHLAIERKGLIEAIEQDVGEVVARLRAERDVGETQLRRQITELRCTLQEREERAAALVEVRKELVLERGERERTQLEAALAQRDARINALEERMQILLRFLSLSGIDPPKGL
jgi:hypothetical protein